MEELALHTDVNGHVWYAYGGEYASNTYLTPRAFYELKRFEDELDGCSAIRLLGTRQNAHLLVLLQLRRNENAVFRAKPIVVGAPATIPRSWLESDPESVVRTLSRPTMAASLLAGWHSLAGQDYLAYALIVVMAEGAKTAVSRDRLLEMHPAWPAVSFLSGFSRDWACRLLCEIVDPRWYAHPTRPDRDTRLYAYLGLTAQNMRGVSGGPERARYFERAEAAVLMWYRGHGQDYGPGDFVSRTLGKYADPAIGLLRGTQKVVSFVRRVWRSQVGGARREPVFDAKMFFQDDAVARAYEEHAKTCGSQA